jgi:NAD(P)-dependent dehydrogenase (short-subunit alcohol dehydrogenase family)
VFAQITGLNMNKKPHWTFENIPDMAGKTAVVTGGNSGLGYYTCRALAARGAQVIMACRDQEKGLSAAHLILNDFPHASLELIPLDLADLRSVHSFAFVFAEKHPRLHILINNAGLMAAPYRQTVDGFELQFGVNHLGHFALTGLLLEQLLAAPDARIVTVSSRAHESGTINFADLNSQRKYARWRAYAQSKLANLFFAYELQRRLASHGYSAISLAAHPGYSATNLQVTGPGLDQNRLLLWSMKIGNAILAQPAQMGALPVLYAATASDVLGGDYFGPGSLFGLRGYPVKTHSNAASHDLQAAARLWSVSEELTAVHYGRLSAG